MPTAKPILLASQSPRRASLLAQLGVNFSQMSPDIDESQQSGEPIEAFLKRLAIEKAQVGYQTHPNHLVIAADTCAEIDGVVIGKPKDLDDAISILLQLSGRAHHIYTSFAIYDGTKLHSEVVRSSVIMRSISITEIKRYWQTQEPADKAGAYAIQGLGAVFVERIEGSYSAIMGLPLFECAKALANFNVTIF